ncbi:MAG: XrtA-associated ATPase [Blastomonas sp.]
MYDSYYGLTGRPFQLTPDPDFYFESNTHRKAMSYLGYGLAQGEGFIVITGEIGAGKSTLVAHLMATVDKQRLTAAQIVTTRLPGDDLLHMVASAFGLVTEGRDKTATLKTIEHFLHEEARAGRRCLLIIDESQNLPVSAIEELRMLSNFQLGSQALLQIFLLGQPEFRDTVQRSPDLEQLRQRVIATHHLDAMAEDEVQPYIEHRLRHVGWSGNPEFTADACARLYAASGGIPRKLNSLANRLMLMGAIESRQSIDGAMVDAVIADLDSDQNGGKAWQDDAQLADYEHAVVAEALHGGSDVEETVEPVVEHVPEAVEAEPVYLADEVVDEEDLDAGAEAESVEVPVTGAVADGASKAELAELQAEFRKLSFERATTKPVDETDFRMAVERICALETRLAEQEGALRRVLTLLVNWVENDALDNGPDNGVAARGRAA